MEHGRDIGCGSGGVKAGKNVHKVFDADPPFGLASGAPKNPDPMHTIIHLGKVDYIIVAIYFVFVLGIGWLLRHTMKGSGDFLTSRHSIPGWVAGIAFLSANLGGAGRQVRHHDEPLLLDRGDTGDGVPRRVHDALLLRIQGAVRSGVPQAPIR
jgi:hypothetical protein